MDAWFNSREGRVGFVMDEVHWDKYFSERFGVPCQISFHQGFLLIHHQEMEPHDKGTLFHAFPQQRKVSSVSRFRQCVTQIRLLSFVSRSFNYFI
jgi:hypothetical protein